LVKRQETLRHERWLPLGSLRPSCGPISFGRVRPDTFRRPRMGWRTLWLVRLRRGALVWGGARAVPLAHVSRSTNRNLWTGVTNDYGPLPSRSIFGYFCSRSLVFRRCSTYSWSGSAAEFFAGTTNGKRVGDPTAPMPPSS